MTAHDRRLTLSARPSRCLALEGLLHWLEGGAIEAAIEAMAKKIELPHWESKGAINRAGEALRKRSLTPDQHIALESWRMAHRTVIHTFEALLRARAAKNQDVQVAQRLKRRTTIVDKLDRYPGMQLARMDDVAGCRLIFPNIEALREFRGRLHHAKFRHALKNDKAKYDYIETPTDRGYRGIHDVYEFRAKRGGGKSAKCNGLLIELQYRTNVQHAWATAVEVVTQLTENEPKFNRGDPRHIRFFCLASEILARAHEGMSSNAINISNKALYEEFDDLEHEIRVMQMLVDLAVQEWIGNNMESDHIILQVQKRGGLKLHQFDLELEASTRLLELEKEFPEDDIVLVGARSVAEVTSAFRNYFSDVREFLSLMIKARERIASETIGKSR